MNKIFCVLLCLLGLQMVHADTSDTHQFINSAGPELQTQVNIIPQIQADLNEASTELLAPVSDENSNILRSLREAQSVLDGNSAIHQMLSQNGQFLTQLSTEKTPAALDTMKAILRATKSDLLAKQQQARNDLESRLDEFFTKINSENLPQFFQNLVNMTSQAIRNVSQPIRAIELFRNQTYANNASDIDPETVFAFAPRQTKEIVYLGNLLAKNQADLNYLEQTNIPSALARINSTVRQMVQENSPVIEKSLEASESESENIINTTAVGNLANLQGLINSTKINLSSQIATRSNALNQTLTEINSTVFAYANLENRTSNLLRALDDQLRAIATAKNASLVNSIRPITNGLGSGINTAAQDIENIVSSFETGLDTVREDSKKSILQNKIDSLRNFTEKFESLYSDLISAVDANVTDLVAQGDALVASVQSSLQAQVAAMIPQSESVSTSVSHLMEQTSELLKTAQGLVMAKLESVKDKNVQLFIHTNTTLLNKLESLRSAADNMNLEFEKSKTGMGEFFVSNLNQFEANNSRIIQNLTESFSSAVESFQASIAPWPSVDAESLDSRVTNVSESREEIAAKISDLSNRIDWIKTNFSLNSSGIPDAWAHDSSIITQLNSAWHQAMDNSSSILQSEIATTMNETKKRSDYAGKQILGAIETISGQFSQMQSIVNAGIASGPEPPTIAEIQSSANQIATSVQSNQDQLYDLIAQLKNEYMRNVTNDETSFQSFIDSLIANLVSEYEQSIGANLTGASTNNDIAILMSNLSNELVYSSDLSGFKSALQTTATNLANIDSILEDKAGDITSEASNLDSLVNVTILPGIKTALNSAVSLASETLNKTASSKIQSFVDDSNFQIDSVVNKTKQSVSDSLKDQFGATLNSLSDYIDYVSSGSKEISATVSFIQHQTRDAVIQLRNISRMNAKVVGDAENTETVEEKKNEEGLHALQDEAKKLENNEHDLTEKSEIFDKQLRLLNMVSDEVLVTNLTRMGEEVESRITNLTNTEDLKNLRKSIDRKMNESRLRHGRQIEKLQNETEKIVTEELNQTAIVPLLEELGTVDKTVSSLVKRVHDVVTAVVKNMPDSSTRIEREQHEKVLKTIDSLDQMMSTVSRSVPAEVKRESQQALGYLRESLEDLKDMIGAHKFPEVNSEVSPKLLLRDRIPAIEHSIQRSRKGIKETVKFVKSNKDFADEFKAMHEKINALKAKRKFKDQQIERINQILTDQGNT